MPRAGAALWVGRKGVCYLGGPGVAEGGPLCRVLPAGGLHRVTRENWNSSRAGSGARAPCNFNDLALPAAPRASPATALAGSLDLPGRLPAAFLVKLGYWGGEGGGASVADPARRVQWGGVGNAPHIWGI